MKSVDDVRHERQMLEYQVDAFLRSRGWDYTSDTPGCFWLWTKTIKWTRRGQGPLSDVVENRLIVTDKSTALSIQHALDERDT